ncbi:MAG: right-handed parallel beta-helix repeat-containing protein [Lachnospiraceae bacterium]|nr:right-handed parallel beta-helix repeat-containing protein [Lachnospiraceae bacterium]
MNRVYYVSKDGSDFNVGTEEHPFLTIQKAAEVAIAGDTVIVREGVYREWVKPRLGGLSDNNRITYMAAEGEKVVIKGSEIVKGWENVEGTVWKVEIANSFFGEYNPYATEVEGDWLVAPRENKVHTGDVYLNGKSFFEAISYEKVVNPDKWTASVYETWGNCEEKLVNPDASIYRWYAEVGHENTVIYANFHGANPNDECVEINVRRSCFFPERTGINYITVKGFEMAQAATTWAPPTSLQYGIIGPHWSKGWIIEDNIIHDSKCSGISLGKEGTTGDNEFRKWMRKPGYQYQMEAVFKALAIGWSKETVGSHIVRNNTIYDCGQNGIVGHLGSAFSEIYGNEIYNIGVKHEYYGHELGGIKFHGAIDTYIHNNYIHHCTLGTWLDWQVQGIRVSSNIYVNNNRDFFIEVTHGPYLVDNNIFADEYTFDNAAQGGAYVNNLVCGFLNHYPVLNRPTPYHFPHSTMVAGVVPTYGGDDRWFQNIFVGGTKADRHYGTAEYNGSTTSMDEYTLEVQKKGFGYIEHFEWTRQPAYIDRNVYLEGALAFEREENNVVSNASAKIDIVNEKDGVYLYIDMPKEALNMECKAICSKDLPITRITECRFEKPNGKDVVIDKDLLGNAYDANVNAGPIQGLKEGLNKIKVW